MVEDSGRVVSGDSRAERSNYRSSRSQSPVATELGSHGLLSHTQVELENNMQILLSPGIRWEKMWEQ